MFIKPIQGRRVILKTKIIFRWPVLFKLWEEHPSIWKAMINIGILLKYKTLKIDKLPKKVTFPSSTYIYVDPNENRGRAILLTGGITQNRLFKFWSKSVQECSPDLIIDVGVNYGECIFSTIYPSHSLIYGIEANHYLLGYIKKSKEAHPNQEQMTIINALASDKIEGQKVFYIDQHWSGTSSASYQPSHNMIEKVSVSTVTIDSLFKEITCKTVLFKVDVEGYEAFVLKGMKNLLMNCESAIGFIEFNSDYIKQSGVSAEEFFAFLQKNFRIYIYLEDDTLLEADQMDFSHLQNTLGTKYIHTDFILVAGKEVLDVKKHFSSESDCKYTL